MDQTRDGQQVARKVFAAGSAGSGRGLASMGSGETAKRGVRKAVTTSSLVSLFCEAAEVELPVD